MQKIIIIYKDKIRKELTSYQAKALIETALKDAFCCCYPETVKDRERAEVAVDALLFLPLTPEISQLANEKENFDKESPL